MTTDILEARALHAGRWPASSSARLAHFAVLMLLNLLMLAAVSVLGIDTERPLFWLGKLAFDLCFFVPILVCRVAGLSLRDLGWHTQRLHKNVALGVVGAFGAMAFLLLILRLAGTSVDELWTAVRTPSLTERLSFLLLGVMAAFHEESVFRGYLQPTLRARWGPVAGLVATALLFDLAHRNFAPLSLLVKLGLGLLFGLLRERGDSLVAPFVAHALFWMLAGML